MIAHVANPSLGHEFEVSIFFTPEYHLLTPKFAIKFDGDLFHPNISVSDSKLNILHERWSPTIIVLQILVVILGFLCAPNPDDPHPDCEGVVLIYRRNLQRFAKYVRKIMG
ncbi:hypothetical protein V6N13_124212 [Hibiscus sabdariffa]